MFTEWKIHNHLFWLLKWTDAYINTAYFYGSLYSIKDDIGLHFLFIELTNPF